MMSVELINAKCTQEEREECGSLELCVTCLGCWAGTPFAADQEWRFCVYVLC